MRIRFWLRLTAELFNGLVIQFDVLEIRRLLAETGDQVDGVGNYRQIAQPQEIELHQTDFFDHLTVTERVEEALDHPERMEPLRQRARETVVERYSVAKCLPAQVKLIEDVAAGRQPAKELVEGAALALEE